MKNIIFYTIAVAALSLTYPQGGMAVEWDDLVKKSKDTQVEQLDSASWRLDDGWEHEQYRPAFGLLAFGDGGSAGLDCAKGKTGNFIGKHPEAEGRTDNRSLLLESYCLMMGLVVYFGCREGALSGDERQLMEQAEANAEESFKGAVELNSLGHQMPSRQCKWGQP